MIAVRNVASPRIRLIAVCLAFVAALGAAAYAVVSTMRRQSLPGPVALRNTDGYETEVVPGPMSAADAVGSAELFPGARMTLFATEPDVGQPIGMAFDDRGRLWVAECRSYVRHDGILPAVEGETPEQQPDQLSTDRIIVLEDVDHDGRHDRRTVFASGLKNLAGIEVGYGGVWAASAPNLLFYPDADYDLRPDDEPTIVLDGFDDTPDLSWHMPNHLLWGPDGRLYGCHGFAARSRPGKPGTDEKSRPTLEAGIWRVDPQTHDFEVVARGTCNPWGIDFDGAGRLFASNNVVNHLWHVVPGACYRTAPGFGANPPQVYEALEPCADHEHWTGLDQWDAGTKSPTGGHAHAGLLIYQGGAAPKEFDGVALIANIQGHRISADTLETGRKLPVAHHGPNLLRMPDPGFRCVDLKAGPDGNIYLCDWSAVGECHTTDDEGTGRIYRISFEALSKLGAGKVDPADIASLSAEELFALQSHSNDWFVRRARLRLQELAAKNQVPPVLAARAWSQAADRGRSPTERLRSLWVWHALTRREGSDKLTELPSLLDDPNVDVRRWACRLAVERDTASSQLVTALTAAAERNAEPDFRLELLSLAQRLPSAARRDLLSQLVPRLTDDQPRDLQRLAWIALESELTTDIAESADLGAKLPGTYLAYAMQRRIAEAFVAAKPEAEAAMIVAIPRLLQSSSEAKLVSARVAGLRDGLADSKKPIPAGWTTAVAEATRLAGPEVREAAASLPWEFFHTAAGDKSATESELSRAALDSVADKAQPLPRRLAALRYSLAHPQPQLLAGLLSLLEESDTMLACRAIEGLAGFDDPRVAAQLLERWKSFDAQRRAAAIEVLTSRTAYAEALFAAIEAKQIDLRDISAAAAARLTLLEAGKFALRVRAAWGEVRPVRAELDRERNRIEALSNSSLPFDLALGATSFEKRCAACHTFKNDRRGWAPALDGVQRRSLEYWLTHILDPSAAVPESFRNVVIECNDGRVASGCIVKESPQSVTLRSAGAETVIARENIEKLERSAESVMPTGLLNNIDDRELKSLLKYLSE